MKKKSKLQPDTGMHKQATSNRKPAIKTTHRKGGMGKPGTDDGQAEVHTHRSAGAVKFTKSRAHPKSQSIGAVAKTVVAKKTRYKKKP